MTSSLQILQEQLNLPLLAVIALEKVTPVAGIRFNAESIFYQTESVTLRNLDKPMPVVL